jgi:hypothetical protein
MYQRTFKKLSAGLLMALLTGCSTVKYVRELPPPELLEDCKATLSEIRTNGQLAQAYLDAKNDLALCNIDKRGLREWANKYE